MFENYSCPIPNVDHYLTRIGMTRPAAPDLEALNAMIYHHHCTVPFEDLNSSLLGLPVSLEIPALYEKIVVKRRGGYCFEMNGLFTQLLLDLGYQARSVFCRIVRGRTEIPPSRHRAIVVELENKLYFCDVGFGGPMPAGAVLIEDGHRTTHHGETFLINRADKYWWTLSRITSSGETEKIIQFNTMPQSAVEFQAINLFCSENPASVFTQKQLVNLRTPDGNVSITDDEFTLNKKGKKSMVRILDETHREELLKKHFGIRL